MWAGTETEVRARMRDRVHDAERRRLVTAARAESNRSRAAGLRQAAGFGLVRTGLWLLDARRV
jgi:hypothetical protein